VQDGE